MARQIGQLSALAVSRAAEKGMYHDGGGLYLLCMSNGRRGWRLKYYLHGREGQVSLGTHPETSLDAARVKARVALRRSQLEA